MGKPHFWDVGDDDGGLLDHLRRTVDENVGAALKDYMNDAYISLSGKDPGTITFSIGPDLEFAKTVTLDELMVELVACHWLDTHIPERDKPPIRGWIERLTVAKEYLTKAVNKKKLGPME